MNSWSWVSAVEKFILKDRKTAAGDGCVPASEVGSPKWESLQHCPPPAPSLLSRCPRHRLRPGAQGLSSPRLSLRPSPGTLSEVIARFSTFFLFLARDDGISEQSAMFSGQRTVSIHICSLIISLLIAPFSQRDTPALPLEAWHLCVCVCVCVCVCGSYLSSSCYKCSVCSGKCV